MNDYANYDNRSFVQAYKTSRYPNRPTHSADAITKIRDKPYQTRTNAAKKNRCSLQSTFLFLLPRKKKGAKMNKYLHFSACRMPLPLSRGATHPQKINASIGTRRSVSPLMCRPKSFFYFFEKRQTFLSKKPRLNTSCNGDSSPSPRKSTEMFTLAPLIDRR